MMRKVLNRTGASVIGTGLLVATAFLMAPSAGATTLFKKSLDDLVKESEGIVVGTVSDVQSRFNANHEIETLVTVEGLQMVHGNFGGSSLTLRIPGGQVGNAVMDVQGAPRFAAKERVLLFVHGNGRELVPFVGWTQGVFRFAPDAAGKNRIKDHEGNSVLGVEGNEVVAERIVEPEAQIIGGQLRSGTGRANSGTTDDGSASSEILPQRAASTEPMDADVFLKIVARKIQETGAKGGTIQNLTDSASLDAAGRDTRPR